MCVHTGLWFRFKLHTIVDNHTHTPHTHTYVESEKWHHTTQQVANFKPLRSVRRSFFAQFLFNGRFNSNTSIIENNTWFPPIATLFCFVSFFYASQVIHLVDIHFWNWILTLWRPPMIYITIWCFSKYNCAWQSVIRNGQFPLETIIHHTIHTCAF